MSRFPPVEHPFWHTPFFQQPNAKHGKNAYPPTYMQQLSYRMPAEWEPQWGVQLTWPHEQTDWKPYLQDITHTYIEMAKAIAQREKLLIVAPSVQAVEALLRHQVNMGNVVFHECPTNDTWARDYGFITLVGQQGETAAKLLDFCFNGWGEKFEASKDNAINRSLFDCLSRQMSIEKPACLAYEDHLDFVLEGGSIESDGAGTVFTTTGCLMAPHRNQPLSKSQIEQQLIQRLHAQRVMWIDEGHLEGDDTDGHIDTLVRIAPNDTLLYIYTDDVEDVHYADLKAMEEQLKSFRTTKGDPYRLLRLPLPKAIYDDGERLPATYANFLVINGAVLVPTYQQPELDRQAISVIQQAFPGHEMIPIDSLTIIRQHGSIHCCTMQFPKIPL